MSLARVRMKNTQSSGSIAFIQEQHSKTLGGLHQEIQKLQQRNARLTFELAMKGSSTSSAGSTEPGLYQHLEEQLAVSKAEVTDLRSALSSRDERVSLLEHQISELEQKLSEEVKLRDASISELNSELESKSNTVAYLTQHLRQAKLRLKKALEDNGKDSQVQRDMSFTREVSPTGDIRTEPGGLHTRQSAPRVCRTFRRTASTPVTQDLTTFWSRPDSRTDLPRTPPSPSPLLTPRPPSSGAPPHALLQRRASNNARRRWSHSPRISRESSETKFSLSIPPRPPSTSMDPVFIHRHPTTPPDVSDILKDRARDVQVIMKPSPPILPPIRSDMSMLDRYRLELSSQHEAIIPSQSVQHMGQSDTSHTQHPRRHRHLILAKAQGLSSAPSALRVLRYSTRSGVGTGEVEEMEEERETEGGGAVEGTLLVRESVNRKDQAWQELHQHGAD